MSYQHPKMDALHMADMVEDIHAVSNLMGNYTFLTRLRQFDRQFKTWSTNSPTLTLNQGKYIGYEAVKGFFLDYNNAQTRWAGQIMRSLYPDSLAGKSDEALWAAGPKTVLTFTTPVIEVAFDGKTAKGLWYVFGETTEVYSSGPKAAWYFGRCGVDFIKEDGCWKFWHMTLFTDIQAPVGQNWGSSAMYAHEGITPPVPTIPEPFYQGYCADYVSTINPPFPEPYDTFSNTFSY